MQQGHSLRLGFLACQNSDSCYQSVTQWPNPFYSSQLLTHFVTSLELEAAGTHPTLLLAKLIILAKHLFTSWPPASSASHYAGSGWYRVVTEGSLMVDRLEHPEASIVTWKEGRHLSELWFWYVRNLSWKQHEVINVNNLVWSLVLGGNALREGVIIIIIIHRSINFTSVIHRKPWLVFLFLSNAVQYLSVPFSLSDVPLSVCSPHKSKQSYSVILRASYWRACRQENESHQLWNEAFWSER